MEASDNDVRRHQTGPIQLLVGFPTGGGTDAIARTLAEKLKDTLGTTVRVDKHGGAGGQIAALPLKAAPADGSTFFLSHDHIHPAAGGEAPGL